MKTSAPSPDPNVGLAQKNMSEIAAKAEARAAENDAYFRTNFAPRYLQQMDDQIRQGRELQDYTMGLSRKYDQRYWDTTAKQQDKFYDTVDNYDTADERDRIAGRAGADVEQATAAGMQSMQRGLARRGVNPGSAAYMSSMGDTQRESSLARAGAMTMAQEAARREGLNLRGVAAGLGGNLTGASSTFAGMSGAAGGQGMAGINGAARGFNDNSAAYGQTMGLAGSSWNSMAQLGMQQQQMRYDANKTNSAMWNDLIGSGIGAAAAFFSDRRLKTNVVRIGTRDDGLGVYEFNYVWGGPRVTGLMADEVRLVYPQAVGSTGGYDTVDYSKVGA